MRRFSSLTLFLSMTSHSAHTAVEQNQPQRLISNFGHHASLLRDIHSCAAGPKPHR